MVEIPPKKCFSEAKKIFLKNIEKNIQKNEFLEKSCIELKLFRVVFSILIYLNFTEVLKFEKKILNDFPKMFRFLDLEIVHLFGLLGPFSSSKRASNIILRNNPFFDVP